MHQTQNRTHLDVMAVLQRGPVTTPRSQNRENHGEGPLHTIADNSVDDITRVNAPPRSAPQFWNNGRTKEARTLHLSL